VVYHSAVESRECNCNVHHLIATGKNNILTVLVKFMCIILTGTATTHKSHSGVLV
jgi:hypothetical protein